MYRNDEPMVFCRFPSKLRICARIETSKDETGSSATINSGSTAKSSSYTDSLSLSTAKFMWISFSMIFFQTHKFQKFIDSFTTFFLWNMPMNNKWFRDYIANCHPWIKRTIWILENHLHFSSNFQFFLPCLLTEFLKNIFAINLLLRLMWAL